MEQESEHAPSEAQETLETQLENLKAPDLTSTPVTQDNAPAEQHIPEATVETSTSSAAAPPPPPQAVLQAEESQPVYPDSQSRVYTLPDSYRGFGGDLCAGYGSLSRATLHSYWPAKNFHPGAHYTLPFLRDSYAPTGLSSQTDGDGLGERVESPLDMKSDHSAASYPVLGGIHQFRPFTTMELLREPSRTR